MPTRAEPSSAGVYATSTCTLDTLVPVAVLLSPPRPGDRSLVLGVRTPDLLRVHDAGAGRPALPRALGQAAGDPQGAGAGRARRDRPDERPESRDEGADRDQRRRLPGGARARRPH